MCSTIDRLGRLSSAEQFFATLGIDFDPHVLNVHRLHILKRFNELVDFKALDGLDDATIETRCHDALEAAYRQFAGGDGTKSFKVFQQQATGFVPLTAILRQGT